MISGGTYLCGSGGVRRETRRGRGVSDRTPRETATRSSIASARHATRSSIASTTFHAPVVRRSRHTARHRRQHRDRAWRVARTRACRRSSASHDFVTCTTRVRHTHSGVPTIECVTRIRHTHHTSASHALRACRLSSASHEYATHITRVCHTHSGVPTIEYDLKHVSGGSPGNDDAFSYGSALASPKSTSYIGEESGAFGSRRSARASQPAAAAAARKERARAATRRRGGAREWVAPSSVVGAMHERPPPCSGPREWRVGFERSRAR